MERVIQNDEELQSSAEHDVCADIFRLCRGDSHLVFANSRKRTESIAATLSDMCEEQIVPNEFFPHHGSLAKELREVLESRLQKGNLPNEKKAAGVKDLEGEVDIYEDRLGSYLVKLSGYDLSDTDSKQISKLLHTIGDFERISDHAVNVMQAAKEIEEKKAPLSPEGLAEIKVATAAIREIMEIAIKAFDENNLELAYRVEPLEQVVDGIIEGIKLMVAEPQRER